MKNYPLYEHQRVLTIRELLEYAAERFRDKTALVYPKSRKEDVSVSYQRLRQDVYALGTALFRRGYRNIKVGLLGENSYEWILTHFAVTCGGGVIVPLDKDLSSGDIVYLLKDSGCTLLACSGQYADIAEEVKKTLTIDCISMCDMAELVAEGKALMENGGTAYTSVTVQPDDMASIVYTSGTTGKPKGVMLSHRNFTASAWGAARNIRVTGPSVLILPLHHCFGLSAALYAEFFYGQAVYINKSLKNLSKDFQKIKPQHLFAVPLMIETLYRQIRAAARKQGRERKLQAAVRCSNILLRCGIDVRKRLFRSVRDAFGGRLELIVSGGAPLNEEFVKAFRSLGISVLNGYGITECAPIVAVNRNRFSVQGSVGVPLCCNTVKTDENGEILVKGENVMLGYYHDTQETDRVLSDGWFRTGDIGFIDKHGALHLTGRIKNLIILGNGENISAEAIEKELYTIPYVKEAVAYGDNGVIAAELFLDGEIADARDTLDEDIRRLNRRLPQRMQIGSVVVRETEFPKTTTKKIIRKK